MNVYQVDQWLADKSFGELQQHWAAPVTPLSAVLSECLTLTQTLQL